MLTLFLLATVAAPAPKLAMTPLRGGDGTTVGMLEMVGESVAAEIRRKKSFEVLTYGELKTVLSHEQVNQLVGCADAGCFANIGNAAGAQALATGRLGKVGASWLIALKIIDVRAVRVVAASDRRIRDGTVDDVLDQLPGMVSELVEGAVDRMGRPEAPAAVAAVSATSSKHPIPPATADTPLEEAPAALQLLSDGAGHLVAFEPDKRHRGLLFAGTKAGLYRQRTNGASASGTKSWSIYFWEPRTRSGGVGLAYKEGSYRLDCGDRDIPLEPVSGETPPLYAPRWRRSPVALARDDKGTYYYVDRERGKQEYRLFVGVRGAVEYQPIRDAIVDTGSSIFIADLGRLIVVPRGRDQLPEMSWAVGDAKQPLTALSLWSQAAMVYNELGAYTGQALGTPCDMVLGESP